MRWRGAVGPMTDYIVPTSAILIHDCGHVVGVTGTDDSFVWDVDAHEEVCP